MQKSITFSAFLASFIAACSPSSSSLTYFHDVKPILAKHCLECHGEGGGVLPRFGDETVLYRVDSVVEAIESGLMPPWVPGPLSVPLRNARVVSADELEVLRAWAASRRTMGSIEEYIAPEVVAQVPSRPPDAVLMMKKPYRPDWSKSDEDRCFLLPAITQNIVAYQWVSDPTAPKHHMAAGTISNVGYAKAVELDPNGDGWECATDWKAMPDHILAAFGVGKFGGQTFADGYSVRVPTGLVLQIHYLSRQAKGASTDGVRLWFAEKPTVSLLPIQFYAPAEVPCPSGDTTSGACSRDVSLASTDDKITNDWLLSSCGYESYNEYLRRTLRGPGVVASTCDYTVTQSGRLTSIHLHAHTFATAARISTQQSDGSWKILLDLPKWRYVWEDSYAPATPFHVNKDQRLRVECDFDNGADKQWSALTGEPGHDVMATPPLLSPQRLISGPRRANEMCGVWIDLAPE